MADTSENWRKRGNAHYQSALESSNLESGRESLLMAFNFYSTSLRLGKDNREISSASKNLAMTAWKLAATVQALNEPMDRCQYYMQEAITYFDKAVKHGRSSQSKFWITYLIYGNNSQSNEWIEQVKGSYLGCIKEYIDCMWNMTAIERVAAVEKMVHAIKVEDLHSYCYLEISKLTFHMSIAPLEAGNFAKALSQLAECHRPLEEARRLGRGNKYITDEVLELEMDIFFQKCAAESVQARQTGDDLLEKLLKEQEELNMDMVYEVMDFYKNAILLGREMELEMEAIALSRLGKLYDLLLMEEKARGYLLRSVQLAYSLYPRIFTSEDWFKACLDALEKYQAKTRIKDDLQKQKEREIHLAKLPCELKQLKEHEKDADMEFLQFIYKTFKPKTPTHTLNTDEIDKLEKTSQAWKKALRKLYLKANFHYHPDKQVQHGDETYSVLCEEITKRINARYQPIKEELSSSEGKAQGKTQERPQDKAQEKAEEKAQGKAEEKAGERAQEKAQEKSHE